MADIYFRGQGRVFIGLRDASGNPKNMRWLGNIPALKLSLEMTTLEHNESWSGQNLQDVKSDVGKKATCTMTLEKFSKDNLGMAFRGTVVAVTAGDPVNDETLGGGATDAAVGDILVFKKRNVSAVTVTDSTASPKTLAADTNYKLHAKAGHLELLDLTTGGPFTQPFKVDYTPGISTEVGMFTAGNPEWFLRFEGLNTLDTNEPVTIDLFKVQFDPAKSLDMITDDVAKFDLDGAVLMDALRAATGVLGQFGAIYNLK